MARQVEQLEMILSSKPDAEEAVEEVTVLCRRGDFAAARRRGETMLQHFPGDPALLHLVGESCCRGGDLRSGVAYLREALAADLAHRETRLSLVHALLALNDLGAAEEICRSGTNQSEPDLEMLRLWAYILQTQGRIQDAIGIYVGIVDRATDDYETWNNLGNARAMVGNVEAAIADLERAASLRPNAAIIRLNLAGALAKATRYEESLSSIQEAASFEPRNPAILLELSRAFSRCGRDADALKTLKRAIALAPRDPHLHVELGLAYASLGQYADAEEAYRAALEIHPRFGPAYLHLGTLLESNNRAEELSALVREADAKSLPEDEIALIRALALRREGQFEEALSSALAAPSGIEPVRRAELIGQIADRLGRSDEAFAAFEEMNRLVAAAPSSPRTVAARYRRQVETVSALTTMEWYEGWNSIEPEGGRASPIFLVGFPRSGTTLLDTILMGHPGLLVLEERPVLQAVAEKLGSIERLPRLTMDEVNELRAHYFATLDALEPAAPDKRIVDKFPLSIVQAPLIHRIFPDARFIFAQRHPCDAVLSCFMTNFRLNEAMANFLDLGDAAELYRLVIGYWDKAKTVFGLNVHDFRYEAMIENAEAELRPLFSFLDLPWDDSVLDHRRTAERRGYISSPSYAQVTERIYARARGRWERYREQMADVLPVLEPWTLKMGYDI
jgi:tetratricopeptide (TPR) repeat protein